MPVIISVILILVTALVILFLLLYYPADKTALDAMRSDDTVTVSETGYGYFFDGPTDHSCLIFYPGAKVEETAYAPLLHSLAAAGIDAFVVRMPFEIAFFNANGADDVLSTHNYSEWYMGGHSLGGVVASDYAAAHSDTFAGVILLASYPNNPLPESLTEIQLIGSEDLVIRADMVNNTEKNSPKNCIRHIIEGGNHAQFGSYGSQFGDGIATISAEEQIRETVDTIISLIGDRTPEMQ